MNYLDFIPYELIVEILLYLDIDELENPAKISTNVRSVIITKLFWIRKLQLEHMSEYIPFLGRNETDIEDYKEFMNIEEEIHEILYMTRDFDKQFLIKLKKYVDIKDLINKYTPEEIGNLVTLEDDDMEHIFIKYKGPNTYKYEAICIDIDIIIGELSKEEVKLLLIKLRLGDIYLESISYFEEGPL